MAGVACVVLSPCLVLPPSSSRCSRLCVVLFPLVLFLFLFRLCVVVSVVVWGIAVVCAEKGMRVMNSGVCYSCELHPTILFSVCVLCHGIVGLVQCLCGRVV